MYKPQDVSRRHKAPVAAPVPAPVPNETHRVENHSKPNRGQQRPPNVRFLGLIPHYSRHPTLHLFFTIFGSAVLLFLLFFLFPWKTQPDRQAWTFRQSIKYDLDNLKGSFSPSTSTVTTTTTLYQTVPTPLYTQEAVPEPKMSTEQT